jgi:hypothetical protein
MTAFCTTLDNWKITMTSNVFTLAWRSATPVPAAGSDGRPQLAGIAVKQGDRADGTRVRIRRSIFGQLAN